MLKDKGLSFEGSAVVMSDSGHVSIYAIEKAANAGGVAVSA